MPDDALAGAVHWDDQGRTPRSRAAKPRHGTGTTRGSVFKGSIALPGWLFRTLSSMGDSLRSLPSDSLDNAGNDDNDDEPDWLNQAATEVGYTPHAQQDPAVPADGVKLGMWTVVTEEGIGNIRFYPFETQELARRLLDEHKCCRILVNSQGEEQEAHGWNPLALGSIRNKIQPHEQQAA